MKGFTLGLMLAVVVIAEEDDDWTEWDSVPSLRQDHFRQDRDHMRKHMGNDIEYDLNAVENEELDFHFFKLHDSNNDNRLDGLEILASLKHGAQHYYERLEKRKLTREEFRSRMDMMNEKLANRVDLILEEDDEDDDGYLSYAEYIRAYRAIKELEEGNKIDKL